MREMLRGRPPIAGRLNEYDPGIFETVDDVEGNRILLIKREVDYRCDRVAAESNARCGVSRAVEVYPFKGYTIDKTMMLYVHW
jgi:hypothetical protein